MSVIWDYCEVLKHSRAPIHFPYLSFFDSLTSYIADSQIPNCCMKFVAEKGRELLSRGLYHNFLLHLVNLYDFSLLHPQFISQIMAQLDKVRKDMASPPPHHQPGPLCDTISGNSNQSVDNPQVPSSPSSSSATIKAELQTPIDEDEEEEEERRWERSFVIDNLLYSFMVFLLVIADGVHVLDLMSIFWYEVLIL